MAADYKPHARLTRAESKQRTRELLLEAAAAVFARVGFAAASLEQVAEEAGFSKGAVYSNFAGKDDLFLALLDQRLTRYDEDWLRIFAEGTSTATRLSGTEQLLARETGADRSWTMLELEFILYALREESARVKLVERYRGVREAMAAALRQHEAETGVAMPLPVRALSWLFPALALGLDIHLHLDPLRPDDLWSDAIKQLLTQHEPE